MTATGPPTTDKRTQSEDERSGLGSRAAESFLRGSSRRCLGARGTDAMDDDATTGTWAAHDDGRNANAESPARARR
ncbi:hypothetical protein DCS_03316 [Drechmeria coniospora]|uniref:Uncharacterized protein n=1 Tax=Drechmeria coniospora TaxID=98403 RepID=A0A151GGT9_DRECN|nr:hypothetical protein DCS_03316 [Drechmeria coniospora]KYK56318.1 hypothetical protein DCS_03316 [Drechmeria coniospora]